MNLRTATSGLALPPWRRNATAVGCRLSRCSPTTCQVQRPPAGILRKRRPDAYTWALVWSHHGVSRNLQVTPWNRVPRKEKVRHVPALTSAHALAVQRPPRGAYCPGCDLYPALQVPVEGEGWGEGAMPRSSSQAKFRYHQSARAAYLHQSGQGLECQNRPCPDRGFGEGSSGQPSPDYFTKAYRSETVDRDRWRVLAAGQPLRIIMSNCEQDAKTDGSPGFNVRQVVPGSHEELPYATERDCLARLLTDWPRRCRPIERRAANARRAAQDRAPRGDFARSRVPAQDLQKLPKC